MDVWLNGKFVDRNEAKVSVFDAGFQHAVGVFETMLVRNGCVFRIEQHLERLAASARVLRLTERLRTDPLAEAVEMTVSRNKLDAARVRLTLTGGDLNLLQSSGRSSQDPTILIVAQPPTEYPEAFFKNGVRVSIAESRDNPFHIMAGHKTLNYWPRIQALQLAGTQQASEALWFSVSNHLVGGCVSNAFLIKDRTLRTPIARGEESEDAIPSCVLPGITRRAVIELAEREGLHVEKRMLTIDDVLSADEVFLTNSSWGVLPVVHVERESIDSGEPGPITQQLRQAWLDLVQNETATTS